MYHCVEKFHDTYVSFRESTLLRIKKCKTLDETRT